MSQATNNLSIPSEFRRFVHYIETDQKVYVKLSFATVDEFNRCIDFFFNRAISQPNLSDKFAESAQKLYFVAPETEPDKNLRRTSIAEIQKRMESLIVRLDNASNVILEEALGLIKFFGELYNVGFIFKGIIKKYLDIFKTTMTECEISHRCYYHLIKTVKEKVLLLSEEDATVCIKSLVEMIEEADGNPMHPPVSGTRRTSQVRPNSLDNFFQKFPSLVNGAPTKEDKRNDEFANFEKVLKELNFKNVPEITKKIEECTKNQFKEGQWQFYYNVMFEKALKEPELAEAVIKICQKLPGLHTDAWQVVKSAKYRKYMHILIEKNLDKLFLKDDDEDDEDDDDDNDNDNETTERMKNIMNLIRELLNVDYCSIGNIASYIEVLIKCEPKNSCLASQILMHFMLTIKQKVSSAKIMKIPHDVRKKVLQIIMIGQGNCRMMTVKDIAAYLDVDYEDDKKTKSRALTPDPEVRENGLMGSSTLSKSMTSLATTSHEIDLSPKPNQKIEAIQNCMSNVNLNDIEQTLMRIMTLDVKEDEEMDFLVENIVEQGITDNLHADFYAELSKKSSDFAFEKKNGTVETFKVKLIKLCSQYFKITFPIKENTELAKVTSLTHFISKLFTFGVATDDFIKTCADILITKDKTCAYSISCIDVMMRIVGPKLENSNVELINRYFAFFEQVLKGNEKSYRSLIYEKLLKLRSNEWIDFAPDFDKYSTPITSPVAVSSPTVERSMQLSTAFEKISQISQPSGDSLYYSTNSVTPSAELTAEMSTVPFEVPKQENVLETFEQEKKIEVVELTQQNVQPIVKEPVLGSKKVLVIDFKKLCIKDEFDFVIYELKQRMISVGRINTLIDVLLHQELSDFNEVSALTNLFKELAEVSLPTDSETQIYFKDTLIEVLSAEFDSSNTKRKLNDSEINSFVSMIVKVGEIYRHGILSDEDLATWLLHKHINKVPLSHLTYLSSIIGPHIRVRGSKHIKIMLSKLEEMIEELNLDTIDEINIDIDELREAINSTKKSVPQAINGQA